MVSDKFKAVLAAKGKSQNDFAEYVGTSKQAVSNKLHHNTISAKDLIALVTVCDCKLVITDNNGFTIELNELDL